MSNTTYKANPVYTVLLKQLVRFTYYCSRDDHSVDNYFTGTINDEDEKSIYGDIKEYLKKNKTGTSLQRKIMPLAPTIQVFYAKSILNELLGYLKSQTRVTKGYFENFKDFVAFEKTMEVDVTLLQQFEKYKTKKVFNTSNKEVLLTIGDLGEDFTKLLDWCNVKVLEILDPLDVFDQSQYLNNLKDNLSDIYAKGALDVLLEINSHAHNQYKNEVAGETNYYDPTIWGKVLTPEIFDAEKTYIDTRDEKTFEILSDKVEYILQNSIDSRIWIQGVAGVGKSTLMYHVFFQIMGTPDYQKKYPIPLLLQPQELNKTDVQLLKEVIDDPLTLSLKIWLRKRNYNIENEDKLIPALIQHIKRGKIVLLLDGYDELSKMKFQIEFFSSLFNFARKYICFTRPETILRKIPANSLVFTIKPYWEIETVHQYLTKHSVNPQLIDDFIHYVRGRENWLKTPRCINIFIKTVENFPEIMKSGNHLILNQLKRGEYHILGKMFELELNRLRRDNLLYVKLHESQGEALKDEIYRRLVHVASEQLNHGRYRIRTDDMDEIWTIIISLTDILTTRKHIEQDYTIGFTNYNWIDFFLAEKISEVIDSGDFDELLLLNHSWSNNLISYVIEELKENTHPYENTKATLKDFINTIRTKSKLVRKDGVELDAPETKTESSILAVNLVSLYFKFIAKNTNTITEVNGTDISLNNLHLPEIDLSTISFKNIDFSNSVLSNGKLRNCSFQDCCFYNCDLHGTDASFSHFVGCTFNFNSYTGDKLNSLVFKLILQGVSFKNCESPKFEPIYKEEFIRQGAKSKFSRYSDTFGKQFFEKQTEFLGHGLKSTEILYTEKIKNCIEIHGEEKDFVLIDLMAGGSNLRINQLFSQFKNLHVIAIDRETGSFEELVEKCGNRIRPLSEDINIETNLIKLVKSVKLKNGDLEINMIIGKKALHEVNLNVQISLLNQSYKLLANNGHAIFFTDSPPFINEPGYQKLKKIVSKMRSIVASHNKVNAAKILETYLCGSEIRFDPINSDRALFSNLWILLKDLANDNINEFNERYFSAVNQLITIANEAGFILVNDPMEKREVYYLNNRLFNEIGVNQAGNYIERHNLDSNQHIKTTQIHAKKIEELLFGNENPFFQLFVKFTEFHLWDFLSNDRQHGAPTEFGQYVNTRYEKVDFAKVYGPLSKFNLPEKYGLSFEFPIHLLDFQKICNHDNKIFFSQ